MKLNLLVLLFSFWCTAGFAHEETTGSKDEKRTKKSHDHKHEEGDHKHGEGDDHDHDHHEKEKSPKKETPKTKGSGHQHKPGEKHDHDDHAGEGAGDKKDSDEHGEEENPSVGPKKGILATDEENGIQLSPEAINNFDLKTIALEGKGPWKIPVSAEFNYLEEVNLFRVRNGFYKRIDFSVLNRGQGQFTVSSEDLQSGDEVVVNGVGFLRIAELAATGGVADGHSH